jgi:predicted naringenin-chalcone synthase
MKNGRKSAAILGIGTAVPEYRLDQDEAAQRLAKALANDEKSARWAKKIFKQCGVETRYTCEPELLADRCRYLPGAPAHDVPSTAERMNVYQRRCLPVSVEAAKKALNDSHVQAAEITHLITVSCTGMFLPGLDLLLTERLGLSPDVRRFPLNFLGCAAGLTAIRLASETVSGNPAAKVLIVCVELCTLHIQPSPERESLFAAAFFGDGASACVVGETQRKGKGMFVLGQHHVAAFPHCADDMVWKIGNAGFHLYLSPAIPSLIANAVPAEIERVMAGEAMPELWAIHPGGRGIIDAMQTVYQLTDEQVRASRSVLRRYGNLSSATILFVLQDIRQDLEMNGQGAKEGIALAFGPGLQAEIMRMTYMPAARPLYEETLGDVRV